MNILLVEDLPMVLNALNTIVDWDVNGFKIIGTVSNGQEAVDVLKNEKTDIVITDIKMPIMDGLELIKYTRENNIDTKVIVLSAYNEFELVREAFKLGASDYILKFEMDSKKILNICEKLRNEIKTEREERKVIQDIKKQMSEKSGNNSGIVLTKTTLKDIYFNSLILGKRDETIDFARIKQQLQLKLSKNNIILMVLIIDNYDQLLKDDWNKNYKLLSFSVINVVEEQLAKYGAGDAFSISRNEFGVVISSDDANTNEVENYCIEIFERLATSLDKNLGIKVSGGLSRRQNSMHSMLMMYTQTKLAYEYRFILGKGKLILYSMLPVTSNTTGLKTAERIEYLKNVLKSLDSMKIKEALPYLRINSSEVSSKNIHDLYGIYEKYTWVFIEFSSDYGVRNACEEFVARYNVSINNTGDLNELNKWLEEIILLFADGIASTNQIVTFAKKYIKEHYSEELTLTSVATALFVSSGYLSRIFKQETGIKFLDYLNLYRIEKAKEYIKEGSLKIYQVSEIVGYKSTAHFSRVFKKVTGKSPKEFAKTIAY